MTAAREKEIRDEHADDFDPEAACDTCEVLAALDAERQTVANAIDILAAAVCNCDAAECIDNALNILRGKSANSHLWSRRAIADLLIALDAERARIRDLRAALHSIKSSELTCSQDYSRFCEQRATDALDEDDRAKEKSA